MRQDTIKKIGKGKKAGESIRLDLDGFGSMQELIIRYILINKGMVQYRDLFNFISSSVNENLSDAYLSRKLKRLEDMGVVMRKRLPRATVIVINPRILFYKNGKCLNC